MLTRESEKKDQEGRRWGQMKAGDTRGSRWQTEEGSRGRKTCRKERRGPLRWSRGPQTWG